MTASPAVATAARPRPPGNYGVDISADFYSRPCVSWLIVADGGLRAIAMWLSSLLEMCRVNSLATTISLDDLTAIGGTQADAALLVQAGLWEEVDDGIFLPCPVDPDGNPIWRFGLPLSRPPIPSDVRNAVYARDGHRCVICSATEDLTLDHIYPWSLGGPDMVDNLRVLCRSCNSRKGARV